MGSTSITSTTTPAMCGPSTVQHPTCWFHLPDELKLLILEHYLVHPKILDRKLAPILVKMRLTPLLRANIPRLGRLATDVFYDINTFSISANDIFLGTLPEVSASRKLRHLEFKVSKLPKAVSDSRSLLVNTLDTLKSKFVAEQWQSGWDTEFAQLRSLHLVLDWTRTNPVMEVETGRSSYHDLEDHVAVLKPVVANMHVKQLKVTLVCNGFCPDNKVGHEGGACECVKQLEDTAQADLMAVVRT